MLIILGMSDKKLVGVFMAVGVAAAFAWVAAIAVRFIIEPVPSRSPVLR